MGYWRELLVSVMDGERVGRIMGVVDGFGIRDDEFFHGLLAGRDDVDGDDIRDHCAMIDNEGMTDVSCDSRGLNAACRMWAGGVHDYRVVFFVSHVLDDLMMLGIGDAGSVFDMVVDSGVAQLLPGRVSYDMVGVSVSGVMQECYSFTYGDGDGIPLSALFVELWEHYGSRAAGLLARVGIDRFVALYGLTGYRLALRCGLSYADGLSLMDDLGDSAAHMDWFVDVVRWVAGHDDVWVNMSLDWVLRYADYPVGFVMESPMVDEVAHIRP